MNTKCFCFREFYLLQITEWALVNQFPCVPLDITDPTASTAAKPEDFEVGLVVVHDRVGNASGNSGAEQMTLKLRFYVILTSKKDLFPEKNNEHRKRVLEAKQYPASKLPYPKLLCNE